jgi:hypothetical protein
MMHSWGSMPHVAQMCSSAAGLGLYGWPHSLLMAGSKAGSEKWLLWKYSTPRLTLRVMRPLQQPGISTIIIGQPGTGNVPTAAQSCCVASWLMRYLFLLLVARLLLCWCVLGDWKVAGLHVVVAAMASAGVQQMAYHFSNGPHLGTCCSSRNLHSSTAPGMVFMSMSACEEHIRGDMPRSSTSSAAGAD